MSDPSVLNGVLSWQDSYIHRSHITPLVRKYANERQSKRTNTRNSHGSSASISASSTTSLSNSFSSSLSLGNIGSSSSTVHDPNGVRILNLQRSVFTDDVDASMQEFQQLLKQFVASLQYIDATGSNITGRVFYNGRNFVVDDPDKEHVSVEAVQASLPANQQNTNDTNSTASSTSTAQTTSGVKSIVRDDHPPLIIRIRTGDFGSSSSSDEDEEDDDEEEEEDAHEGEGGRGRAFSDGVEGACREGETNAEDSSDSDSHESSDVETPTASTPGHVRSRSSHKKKKNKKKRKRREAMPEIVDLTETPLLQLLQAQIQHASNSPHHRHHRSLTAASASTEKYDYYYYVRTLYQENEKNFLRYYVQLNWLPYLQSIIMSSTPISGYGVVSLVASSCSNLQLLHLSDCPNLDNTGIYSIVNLCISLRRLDISRCRMVNRFGLMYLSEFDSSAVRSLEYVDISHCGGNDTEEERRIAALEARQNPQQQQQQQQQQQAAPRRKNSSAASRTSLASPFSAELVSLAVFNALEERGFHGRFIWQHTPRKEELFGTPQYVPADTNTAATETAPQPSPTHLSFPPSLFGNMSPDNAAAVASAKSALLPNVFAPPTTAPPRQELQLLSPFHQAYSLAPDRIMDLATRDITAQVLCEVPWSYIKQQDRVRMERLKLHQVTLGTKATPNDLPAHLLPVPLKSGTEMGGFVEPIEAEMERQSITASLLASASGSKNNNVIEPPKFYSLDLSGHLINDKLLGYILHNWGKSLYALILNGTYITASGLSELHQCTNLHILSITHCSNITDKARANEVLKQSLKSIPFLMELNLTNSRLSGRMMSTHPNLKLQTLIANGCPISAFAIRMLSSAASTSAAAAAANVNGEAATPSAPPQNMCKYSLRFLSLANCAFVNRKALDYILKFSYLHLIDLSDCKGIKRDDIMDTFYVLIDNEQKSLEAKSKRKKSSSSNALSKDSYSSTTISNFGCLLCHLHYIICFGIGGNGFNDKRTLEFQKELNASADKLQKLMLNIYYQQQAALDSQAQQQQQAAAAAASNLAAPPPFNFPQVGGNLATAAAVRGTPPPLPAFLSRDFLRDPIIVVSNRASNVLARYQPTLTRFAPAAPTAGSSSSATATASSRNQLIPMGVPIPSGLILGAAAAQLHPNADIAPPTMFRSNSLLDECPYTVLPPPITPPTPPVSTATPSSTSTTTTTTASSTPAAQGGNRQPAFGSSTAASTLFGTMPIPGAHPHRPSMGNVGPVSNASSLPSYMTLGHENASGGMMFPGSTSPQLHHPHPHHVSTHPHLHVAPSASPSSAMTGGELYVAMPSMQFNNTTPASAPPHHSSLEGVHRPFSSTAFASTLHSPAMSQFPLATPSPAATGATPYDAPNALMFNSPSSAPTLSAPTSIHSATARASTTESNIYPSAAGVSSLAAPLETVARASSASVGSMPQTSIPIPSFWSTLGPTPSAAPAPAPAAVTPSTAAPTQANSIPSTPQSVNSTPAAYVSPFAALTHSHPTSNVSSTASTPLRPALQPSLFNTSANASASTPTAFPAFPSAFPSPFNSQFTSNANTPLQPGMSLSSIGLPVASVPPTHQQLHHHHHQAGSSSNSNNPGGVPSSSPSPSPSPSPPLQPVAASAGGVPIPNQQQQHQQQQEQPLFASLPQSAASSTAFEQALANAAAANRPSNSNAESHFPPVPTGEGSQS